MASVYLGRAQGVSGFQKMVALKLIHPHLAEDENFLKMFLDEARLSARLNHPNICSVFDFGEIEGIYYIAMEYLHGESLRSLLGATSKGPRLPIELGIRIVADAARGLHAAHELVDDVGLPLGVVHRDVSPHNIFVLYEGLSKVVDFGIAKARDRLSKTDSDKFKGKLAYMAPEQLDSKCVDRRTDIFALGVVLWECIVGKRLFQRPTSIATMAAVLREDIVGPSDIEPNCSSSLDSIVMRALKRDPEQRWQSMDEMADALENHLFSLRLQAGTKQVSEMMKATFANRIEQRTKMIRDHSFGRETNDYENVSTDISIDPFNAEDKEGSSPRRFTLWGLTLFVLMLTIGATGWYFSAYRHHDEALDSVVQSPTNERDELQPISDEDAGSRETTKSILTPDTSAYSGEVDATVPLKLSTDASSPQREAVDAEPRKQLSNTKRQASPGYVNIVSIPVSMVWIGGRRLGMTPLKRIRLPAGTHTVKLRSVRGEEVKTSRVKIRPGKVSFLSIRFDSR